MVDIDLSNSKKNRVEASGQKGDSGAIMAALYRGKSYAIIDGIVSCVDPDGEWVAGNTAYHVKTSLEFDFNCANRIRRNVKPSSWGKCPVVNR